MEVALLVTKTRNMGAVFCENFETRTFMGCFCNLRICGLGIASMFRTNLKNNR